MKRFSHKDFCALYISEKLKINRLRAILLYE